MQQDQATLVIVAPQALLSFARECFRAAGFAADTAQLLAESLIEADLRGLNTHGVLRIPMYLQRVRAGLIDPEARVTVVKENANMAILDAGNGMGQPASVRAMEMAIAKAREATIGLVGVRNSNHYGTAAYYSMMAAKQCMLGVSCSNTEPLMAAPGGAAAVVGNNPFSIAIPGGAKPDIVIDMAMSAAAIGKIVLAQKKGQSIPAGWATDKAGQVTEDPGQALDGGCLLPFAGPKGYGLALAVDVVAGILMGSGFGAGVYSPFTDFEHQQKVGHMFMAVDIGAFTTLESFLGKAEELIGQIKSAPTAPGVEEVFLPGEMEQRALQTRQSEGVPLPVSLIAELNAYAESWGSACRI